jgi:co-chaperonin GroES (HSP10)|tara:strand:+ start:370 stop:783 length:414 start_codon:yes stop_codon:yes gene_type:complete
MEAKVELATAYVEPDDVVLDPDKLDGTALERMPQPTGWRILVLPYRAKNQTKGGIVLTKETVEKESLATLVAYVVKKGPLCYSGEKYGKHWCQEKQWVLISRYAGARFKLDDGAEVRIINDDEVIATISNPNDIVSL